MKTIITLLILSLATIAHSDSVITYPVKAIPVATDQVVGIDTPAGTWSVKRFSLQAILNNLENDMGITINIANLPGGIGGDDLGAATSADVGALFSGGGVYLKADGTTGPGGEALISGTPVADQVSVWLNATTLKGVDADDLVIAYSPTNYSAATSALDDHLTGIDAALSDADPLLVNNAPADHSVQGGLRIEGIQAGEAIARFMLVYRKYASDNLRLFKYGAATAFTDNDTYMPVGMTTSAAAVAGDPINIVTGTFYLKTSDYTETYSALGSRPVYASVTVGEITMTAPSAAGDKVIIVGHLWGNDRYLMSLPATVDVEIPVAP